MTAKSSKASKNIRVIRSEQLTEEERFEALYLESYDVVYNYAYYRLLNRQAAEDVVSETYLRAARSFRRYDPTRAKFTTWVCSIARNCATDYQRKQPALMLLGDDMTALDMNPQEDQYPALDEDAELCQRLLSVLADENREIVFMKYYLGMRNTEIAERLGMNVSTVATKLQRSLDKMRKAV